MCSNYGMLLSIDVGRLVIIPYFVVLQPQNLWGMHDTTLLHISRTRFVEANSYSSITVIIINVYKTGFCKTALTFPPIRGVFVVTVLSLFAKRKGCDQFEGAKSLLKGSLQLSKVD